MNKITKAELARLFNVNQSRINALLNEKQIVETDDGFIDLDDPHNQNCIERRKTTVPKYTGVPTKEELIDADETEDKKSSEENKDPLYDEKVAKYKKENELLELRLKKEKRDLIDTKQLNQILMRSYEIFFNLLMETPYNIIDELRDIILTNSNKNNEDLQLLIKTNKEDIYIKGLEETRKAIKSIYE